VVDPNFAAIEMYRPDVYQTLHDAIAANYQPAAETAPVAGLVLEVPQPGPASH